MRFAVDQQFTLMYEEPMLSVLKKGNKIRKDKLKELHRLLQKLCEHNGVEDKSEQYTDTMKKILRHREILDLKKMSKFRDLLDLDAQAIPKWGAGDRNEWQGRYKE